jgi:hypothetical protein
MARSIEKIFKLVRALKYLSLRPKKAVLIYIKDIKHIRSVIIHI